MNNIKRMPVFRGRFGTRSVRRKSNKKWQRWRYPRGIDITWKRGQVKKPKGGYAGNKKYRNLHPSGRIEVYIKNLLQLQTHIKENKNTDNFIYRIASNLGVKKRNSIKEFADKHKLRLINVKKIVKKEKPKKEKTEDKKVDSKKVESKKENVKVEKKEETPKAETKKDMRDKKTEKPKN